MSPDLDAKLCADFPSLFVDRYKSPKDSCMHWGFECNDGWYNLIHTLCTVIVNHEQCNIINEKEAPPCIADQVKEKYGTLRFYTHGGDEYIEGAIRLAEIMSASICEMCGKPGTSKANRGWQMTRCDECMEKI